MSVRTLVKTNDPILRERSREVDVAEIQTQEFKELIADMKETMKADNGVGLAAPQIGISKRLITVDTPQGSMAFINPVITKLSRRQINSEEGCLSVPGVFGIVKRSRQVIVQAIDEDGQEIEIKATGLTSTIFQHEIDHLDGILFIDKAKNIQDLAPDKHSSLI